MMEQQLELQEPIIREDLFDLKAILLDSKTRINSRIVCKVPNSRYAAILSSYWAMYAINVDGAMENYLENTSYFKLIDLDNNGNVYKIVRMRKVTELKAKCSNCDCGSKRWINNKTGSCYYKEMITNNYTTKIK